jgi:hypothetical protein
MTPRFSPETSCNLAGAWYNRGMKRKTRVRKVDQGEYFVEYLDPFDSWTLAAIVFQYPLARKVAKLLKDTSNGRN